MNHDDSDAFDVLPLFVCGGSLASDWASIPVSQTHGLHCHLRLSRDLLPSSLAKALFEVTDQVFSFFSGMYSSLNRNDVHFVVFMFKTNFHPYVHSLLGLPCVTFLSFCPLFLFHRSHSFPFSPVCSDNALWHVLKSFPIQRASSFFDSLNRQQKVSERTLCGCYCAVRGALHLSLTETDNDVIAIYALNEKYQLHLFKQLLCGCVCGNLCEVF